MTSPQRAVLGGALALLAGGCGGGGSHADRPRAATGLTWAGKPQVYRSRGLPRDRVVIARVRNAGSTTLHLVAARLKVRDAHGRALRASAAFSTTFAHGLYGAYQQPAAGEPVAEQIRLGKIIYLAPGASAPFYAAWRLTPGAREPVHVDYGSGSLAIPPVGGQTAR
ncbi:MAG: hypothetical protein QOF12_1922 [Solirubrobacteraceae bacterium]|nr:hypothetical protein [Solirubrobacteraceae bacterium]